HGEKQRNPRQVEQKIPRLVPAVKPASHSTAMHMAGGGGRGMGGGRQVHTREHVSFPPLQERDLRGGNQQLARRMA
ncbi:hypothetical protein HK102_000553, partial [Quaeritorhiza haematococci]